MDKEEKSLEKDVVRIVEKYSDMVYRLALTRTKNKRLADDIFQEVFLRFIKNINKISSEDHCKAWLITVTINCSKSFLNSFWFKKVVFIDLDYVKDEKIVFDEIEKSDVYYAVMSLSQKYRTVIHLYYYEDLSISKISEILNLKESTVKTQLSRARNKLKIKLEGGIYNDEKI